MLGRIRGGGRGQDDQSALGQCTWGGSGTSPGQRRHLGFGGARFWEKGIFGNCACTGKTMETGALSRSRAGLLDGERWLGLRLAAAKDMKALGPAVGGGGRGRPRTKASNKAGSGSAGPCHRLPWLFSTSLRPRSPACDCAAVDCAAGGDPALGLACIGGCLMSTEGAPVVPPPQPPPWVGLTRSLRDPALTSAPTSAARLAPWTGSQTSRACSRSYSCSKTRSHPTQPHSV